MSELIFVGGISGTSKWLDDGKTFSRNFKQGSRVYSSEGVATALTAQPVGGLGGFTSLYLVDENMTKEGGTLAQPTETLHNYKPFKYVSFFSGIGGFEQALNKLGGTCVMASEIDKYANRAYEVLYGHPTVGDVTKIVAKDVPDHDVLVGGFPCQAFSVAGKRLGFEDTRGTLFFEMARVAKEKKPKVILAENVKGLVSHDKGRTLDVIVQTLNEIGYRVDFEILNSKYFGVAQNRERIFIVAIREDLVENEPWTNVLGNTVIPKGKRRISQIEGIKTFNFDYPSQEAVTTRLRDILEDSVDEKYYLSEDKTANLVAQLEEKPPFLSSDKGLDMVGSLGLAGYAEMSNRVYSTEGLARTIMGGGGNAGDKTGLYLDTTPQMIGHIDLKGHDAIKRVYASEGIAPTLTTMGGGHRQPKIAEEVRACLTPEREEKRQNGPRFKANDEPAHTINTQDRHGVAYGSYPKYRIRKLTPLECFRLQSFPDEAHAKLVDAGISNSQLYKMAGNAVTVNVIEAIGKRLLPYLDEDTRR